MAVFQPETQNLTKLLLLSLHVLLAPKCGDFHRTQQAAHCCRYMANLAENLTFHTLVSWLLQTAAALALHVVPEECSGLLCE